MKDENPPSPSVRTLVERFVLFGLAVAVLHFGKPVFLPIVSAGLVTLLLTPGVRLFQKTGMPDGLAAGTVVLLFVALLAVAGYYLRGPAAEWVDRAPEDLVELEREIGKLRAPVDSMVAAAGEVGEVAQGDREPGAEPVNVDRKGESSLADRVINVTWKSVSFFILVTVLVFFMLMGRGRLMAKVVMLTPDRDAWQRVEDTVTDIRKRLSTFILTMTVINAGLGTGVGVILWVLGYESPVLWGVMVAVLNFVPYLGSATGMIIVGTVGLLTFDGVRTALLAVSGYLVLTTIEGTIVSPGLLSSRLRLDPVATLGGLLVFGFVWGIPGVLLTVPILVVIKAVSENYGDAATFAALVGQGHESVPIRTVAADPSE